MTDDRIIAADATSEDEAIEILMNVRRLAEVLLRAEEEKDL